MTKAGKKSVPGIQTRIKEWSATIIITIIATRISTTKSRRRKNTGIPTVTVGRDVVTTIVEDSTNPAQMVTIASLGTNVVMRRVQRMNDAQSHATNIVNNLGIAGDFKKPGKSKSYRYKRIHHR